MTKTAESLAKLSDEIFSCTRCPRLIAHCRQIAQKKKREFASWDYWGKPLPGIGDPMARLLIIGLAPAAHGGNRTGRMFTGDSSADWLMEALHHYGFSNQPTSDHINDGLELRQVFITASARCAPPANRPTAEEMRNCQPFLERELELLTRVHVVMVLGQIAFDRYWRILREQRQLQDHLLKSKPKFAHGALYDLGPDLPNLLVSYHPSRQNTQTGRLTKEMFHSVFAKARELVDAKE